MTLPRHRLLAFVCEQGVTIPRNGEGWRTLMQIRAECPSSCRFVILLRGYQFVLLDMWFVGHDNDVWYITDVDRAEQTLPTFEAAVMAGHIRYNEAV